MKKLLNKSNLLFLWFILIGLFLPMQVSAYYIAGWGGNWNPDAYNMGSGGTYTFSMQTAGEYKFKVTAGNWDTQWGCGSLNASDVEGVATKGQCNNGGDDVVINLSKNADVTITFNGSKITVNAVENTTAVTCFLKGSFDSWGDGKEMTLNGGEYQITNVSLTAGQEVKIYYGDNKAGYSQVENPDSYISKDSQYDNIVIEETGTYSFYYKIASNKIWLVQESSSGSDDDDDDYIDALKCDPANTKIIFTETFGTFTNNDDRTSYSRTLASHGYVARVGSNYSAMATKCTAIKDAGKYAVLANPKWAGCGTQSNGDTHACDCNDSWWYLDMKDHTSGDTNGGMLMFNCNDGTKTTDILYECELEVCAETYINFSAFIAPANALRDCDAYQDAGVKFILKNKNSGEQIASKTIKNIKLNAGWQDISVMFNAGEADNATGDKKEVVLQFINVAVDGNCGNDLLIDDITLSVCTPQAVLETSNGTPTSTILLGKTETLTAEITSGLMDNPYYLWQVSDTRTGTWINLTDGAVQNKATYTVTPDSPNLQYRVIIAPSLDNITKGLANVNTNNDICGMYAITNIATVTSKALALAVSAPDNQICVDGEDYTTIEISVTNPLGTNVTGVTVNIDNLADFTATKTSGAGTYSAGVWTIGDIAAGTTQTLKLKLTSTKSITASSSRFLQSYVKTVSGISYSSYTDAPDDSKKQTQVTLNPLPEALFSVNKETICDGSTTSEIAINVNKGTANYTLTVDGKDYSTSTVPYILKVTPSTTKTYTLTQVKDSKGCIYKPTQNNTATVTVEKLSITTQPTTQTVCVGGKATFTVVAEGATKYTWEVSEDNKTWELIADASTTSSTYTTPAVTADDNGKYYRVNVCKDGGKCGIITSNSAQLIVTTIDKPTLLNNGKYDECSTTGDISLSTLFSGTALKYYSDPELKSEITTGTFSASEIVKDKPYYATQTINGCTSDAAIATVTVKQLPKLTSVVTNNNAICGTDTDSKATLTYNITGGKSPYGLTIQRTEGNSTSTTTTEVKLESPGTYDVKPSSDATYKFIKVSDSNGCYSEDEDGLVDDITIDVQNIILLEDLSDRTVCADKTLEYIIKASGDNLNYQWYESVDNGVTFNKVGTNSSSYKTNAFEITDKKQYKVDVYQSPEVCSTINSKESAVTVTDCSKLSLSYGLESQSATICMGEEIKFKYTLTNSSDAANIIVNITNIADQTLKGTANASLGEYDHDKGVWNVGNIANGAEATLEITIVGSTAVKDNVSTVYVSKAGTTEYTIANTIAISTQTITVKNITQAPTLIAETYKACPESGMLDLETQISSDKTNLKFYTSETGTTYVTQASKSKEGTTTYWVTSTKDGECESPRTQLDIVVYPQPTAKLTGDATICNGKPAYLAIKLSGTPNYTVTYAANVDGTETDKTLNKISDSEISVPVYPTETTTYSLKEVIDGNSCKATLTGNVEVVVNDKAEISISAPDPICAGDPLDLTNKVTIVTNGSTVTNGNWYLDDAIYTEGSPVSYEKNGAILKYKATSSCGGTIESTNSFAITVKAKATITIVAPADLCIQDPLQLQTPTINYNGSTVSGGKWYLDGEEYNGADLVYKDEAYTLQYKANSSCGGETKSNEVTFKVKDRPTINLTEVDLGELCAGTELDLPTVTTKENNSTISSQGWLLGTSSITSPIDALSTDVHDGKTITYTATNECGTTKVDYTTLSVKDCADFTLTFDLDNSNPCFEDVVTLTATITNNGGSDLSNVVLSLQGPNAQASVTTSTSGDIVSNYSAGVWTIPTFTSKTTATLTIKFSAQASEELKIYVSESNGVPYASYAESPAKDTEELVVKEISDDVEISDNYIMCPTESSSTMFLSDFVISNQDGLNYFDKNADGTYTALTSEPTFDPSLEFASHTYYITNTEKGKCESTTPTPITIEIYKPVKASISGLSPLCSGETSNVNITLEGTPEFTVVYNNGTADITQKTSETTLNIAESLSSTTTYILVSVTDINNCSAYLNGTEIVAVTVNPRPELESFEIEDSDDIICEGESTNLKATFTGTAPFTFKINGEEKTSDANEWSMTISDAKEYVITDLSDANCSAETISNNSVTLIVEELPEVTLSATDVTLNCTTPIATITASGAYKYEWSYLDQTGATQTKSGSTLALQQTDPEVSSLVTEYTVYGYSENANCKSEEAKTVKVTEDFVKPVVDIKISETADGTIPERLDCYQQNIKLEADLTNNKETIVEYIWSSGSDNNTTLINNPGAYTLQVKGENGCISDVATETIEQNILKPEVSIESYITDPVTGNIIPTVELTCANNEITLEGTITNAEQYAEDYPNGEFTYLWSDGSTTSSIVAKTPLATSPMEYTLIVKSPNGCLNEVDKAKVTVTENVNAPVLNIESVYKLCPSDTLSVKALSSLLPNTSGVTYKFYDESGEEIEDLYDASSADAITEYYVTGVSANGCQSEKTSFEVDFAKNVDFTLTTSQSSMMVGGNETIVEIVPDADSDDAATYVWTANDQELSVDGLQYVDNLYLDTNFKVTASNRCDSDTQEAFVEVLWPTAFTPHNGNGKNDTFAKGMKLMVFNRFYTKIFEGEDGWDGSINGTMNSSKQTAVPGVYFYSVQLPNGQVKKGTIEIVKVD